MNKFLALLGFFCGSIFADFNHPSNKIEDDEITLFQVLGERCSGTNYLAALIEENFHFLKSLEKNKIFIHKHFIPWVFNPDEINSSFYYQIPKQNIIYIVLIRNVYDWIRSFYLQPFHIENHGTLGFDHFVFSEIEIIKPDDLIPSSTFFNLSFFDQLDKRKYTEYLHFHLDHLNPLTGVPFKNLLELRSVKYRNYLEFRKFVPNIIYLSFEQVKQDPEAFIDWFSGLIRSPKAEYVSIDTYRNDKYTPFIKKEYFGLTEEQKAKIEELVDKEIEAIFGYEIR
jgi:hypothetical protein